MGSDPPVDMQGAYDRYFSSGLYGQRYPRPNPRVFGIVRDLMETVGPRVLDFGCGDGRYAAPILDSGPRARVIGYDISATALEALAARRPDDLRSGRLRLVLGSLDALAAEVEPHSVDLGLMLFGVLGHVPTRAGRIAALRAAMRCVRPGGRLVVTVPNARRRFLEEQRESLARIATGDAEPGDILYQRQSEAGLLRLYYHLYSLPEFAGELAAAGLVDATFAAESVLPERGILVSRLGRIADDLLARSLDIRHAYGFLAVATVPAAGPVETRLIEEPSYA
jgi:tRNA (uracil-5-)-methyltransferase TRM9